MKWTLNKAAQEWRVDRRTLEKKLMAFGLETGKGATYHTRDITSALVGDLERERTLETIERRKALEMENAEREGSLVMMDDVQKMVTDVLLPVRQRLLAMPTECATRANPTDPQFARDALQRWVDDSLPMIREKLPKPKKK